MEDAGWYTHMYPSTEEAEAWGMMRVLGQPGLHSECHSSQTLSQNIKNHMPHQQSSVWEGNQIFKLRMYFICFICI